MRIQILIILTACIFDSGCVDKNETRTCTETVQGLNLDLKFNTVVISRYNCNRCVKLALDSSNTDRVKKVYLVGFNETEYLAIKNQIVDSSKVSYAEVNQFEQNIDMSYPSYITPTHDGFCIQYIN